MRRVDGQGLRRGGAQTQRQRALDDAGADPRDVALDRLVARRAHNESAAWVDGREESVAVLEAVAEFAQSGLEVIEEPGELTALEGGLAVG